VKLGVLALQGAFRAHRRALAAIEVDSVEVRLPGDLVGIDGLIMPGGESTTMSLLLDSTQLFDPIAAALDAGLPVFGTCAGLILLASEVTDGRADQRFFGRMDIGVQRNAYGRQVESFESELEVNGLEGPIHGVFIRAPRIVWVGDGVEVLARDDQQHPVLVRDGNALGAVFHPELSGDARLHRLFAQSVAY
jgi:5'-phosphate synthase pdxT subunit